MRSLVPRRAGLPISMWGLCRDAEGALTIHGIRAGDLIERWGSPLHVVDLPRLQATANRFSVQPAGASGGCEVYCSYKTNPVPGVLRALHLAGAGAEVVSPYELWLAMRLGVPGPRIVYNGPAKSDESLVEAIGAGVGLLNLNCRTEIERVSLAARATGKTARVGIRVVVPGNGGGQFGERIDTGAALRAFEQAMRTPGIEVVAIHSHFNGEISSRDQLDPFLSGLLRFTDVLRDHLGLDLEIIDLGGNLASPTVSRLSPRALRLATTFGIEPAPRDPASVLSIERYVTRIVDAVEGHYRRASRRVPRLFLEPGRALMGDAQFLLTRVIQVRDPGPEPWIWAVLDAGINVAESLRSEWHQLVPVAPRRGAPHRLYRLTGPSCTRGDLLYPAWALPEVLPGDVLAVMDSGAYFVPFSTDFSFPRPGVVAVDGSGATELRRARSFSDLVASDPVMDPRFLPEAGRP